MLFDKKLSPKVLNALKNNVVNLRVIIKCTSLLDKAESKLISYKCNVLYKITNINCIFAIATPFAVKRLIEFPFVKYIEIDSYAFLTQLFPSQNDSATELPRYVKSSGYNVGIGLISTGVYPHPNFKFPINKIRLSLDLVNGFEYPYDDNGNGTFLAGIMCGKSRAAGHAFSGVAPDSYICSIKAFDITGKGFISTILFALETLITSKDEHKVRIICLPCETFDNNNFILELFSALFDKAIENNIIVILPSGNNGNIKGSLTGINTLRNCLTIGGADVSPISCKIYNLSSGALESKLNKPDFILPCTNVKGTTTNTFFIPEIEGRKIFPRTLDSPYNIMNGTCVSTAYACGLCAILLERFPNLSFKDIYTLFKHASHLIDAQKYLQGNGYLDPKDLFSNVFMPKSEN